MFCDHQVNAQMTRQLDHARVPGGAAQVVAVAQQREPSERRQRPQTEPQRRRRETRERVQREFPQAARQLRGGGHAAVVHVPQPVVRVSRS